ncbi:MAG: phosphoglucosamine mutase [Proteobacteria bacterium]|nr:phosphoglucosamine mutase [Pseudomonadota bacterium]
MGILFGTDGIRARANTHPMTAEIALKTGRALAMFFNKNNRGKIIIGKDTRLSGDMFEHALAAGACSMGVDVYLAGVIPTPGIAYLARTLPDVVAGVVISASHNPFQDNGIKIFKGDGFKLDNETEALIEKIILENDQEKHAITIQETGRIFQLPHAASDYAAFIKDLVPGVDFSGIKAVIDCSNGASSQVAPALFKTMGLDVTTLFTDPDGKNINLNCGSEHIETMVEKVIETNADIGLAFDGDADRLIAVDQKGRVVTGDQIIAICAVHEKEKGNLKNNTVVTTVMSNMGLGSCLKEKGINHIMSQVGDRHVMMDMVKAGAVVGGEDSGHMIFLNHHTTGDGIISALMLLAILKGTGRSLENLAKVMTVYPQMLENIDVTSKPDISTVPEIVQVITESEKELEGRGRVLVRYSGTQSLCRVMVEAPSVEETKTHVRRIADMVKKTLGS